MGQIPLNHYVVPHVVPLQVDTVSGTQRVAVPHSGKLEKVVAVLDGADMDADTVIDIELYTIAGATLAFQFTLLSTLNDKDVVVLHPRFPVSYGDGLRLASDGAQVGVTQLRVSWELSQ